MNREILFQIWDKEKKRMSKPLPVFWPWIEWSDGDIDMPTDFALSRSERFVFRQFTGLKDGGATHIYDGDIIEVNWLDARYKKHNHLVEWNNEYCAFQFPGGYPHGDSSHFEVIGNKFQNPELIPTK